jgi:hypothetical protein
MYRARRMRHILAALAVVFFFGCASNEYRFERIDEAQAVALPLNFEGLRGIRDGSTVKFEGRFANAQDVVTMNVDLFLRPPAEFRSGTYEASIGGKQNSGVLECPSLAFQGGQTALPTVGGVFVMKDEQGRALYRVRIPPTALMSRRS